jgi:hypothetical protein
VASVSGFDESPGRATPGKPRSRGPHPLGSGAWGKEMCRRHVAGPCVGAKRNDSSSIWLQRPNATEHHERPRRTSNSLGISLPLRPVISRSKNKRNRVAPLHRPAQAGFM